MAPGVQGVPPELLGKPQGNWAKADNALRGLAVEFAAHRARGEPGEFQPSNSTLQFSRGRVVVDIVAQGDPAALMAELRTLGLRNASQYGQVISGTLPVGALSRAVEVPSIQAISAALRPLTNTGSVDGKGDDSMFADAVRASSALTGADIRIGMLSDSFNQKSGAANGQASGDLPSDVIVLDDSANCGGPCNDEGRAMMELAYDVAPGASFAFHTAFGGMADFANGIEELAHPGQGKSDIVVDDVIYFAEPMFQDGIIARAADNVVAQGVPYFSSAGNYARRSYESAFVDSGELHYVRGLFGGTEYRGRLHDFNPDPNVSDWHQDLTVPDYTSHRIITIVLQWDQPFGSLSSGTGADVDLDIYLTDTASPANMISKSEDNNALSNGGTGEPIEILQFQVGGCDSNLQLFNGIGCVPDPGNFRILIALYDAGNPNSGGPDYTAEMPGKFKYVMFDHNISWQYPTNSSTTFGHANAAGALATGAAYWEATPRFCNNSDGATYNDCETADGAPTATLEWFSSAGGTPILFDASGNRLGTPDLRRKPEVTGPDGTNTTFFYSDSTNDADTLPNFFGTSASAPHVAGVAALMLEANSGLLPADIYDALESTAVNMNPRPTGSPEELDGFDFDTGYGFVDANAAVALAAGVTGNDPPVVSISAPTDGTTVNAGDSVSFAGSATDTEDDNATLTGQLDWTSSIDGLIGTDTSSFSRSDLSAGTHTITASVTDSGGRTGQASVTLTVNDPTNEPPTALFDILDNPCPYDFLFGGWVCEFKNNSTDDDGVPTASWRWDFGDGTENTEDWDLSYPKSVLYTLEGEYQVTLTVTDAAGATHSVTHPVYIGSVPASNVHIGDLDGSATTRPRNRWDATVTVTVHDGGHQQIGGAEVNGTWSDGTAGICTTVQTTGSCDVTYADLRSNVTSIGFSVDYITGTVDAYDPAANDVDPTVTVYQTGSSPNTAPAVSISAPNNGSSFDQGTSITFSGSASDAEDDNATLTGQISWSSDLDGAIGTGGSVSTSSLRAGTHTITAAVTDSGGLSDTDAISVTINAISGNTAPAVSISAPNNGSSFDQGTSITFSGSASDAEDDNATLTGEISWTSDLDGAIGTGGSVSTSSLRAGTHMITASVTDSGRLSATDSISVTVRSLGGFSLIASGYKDKGEHVVDLTWTGFTTGYVDILRNGDKVNTVKIPFSNATSTGSNYTDRTGNKGGATYDYQVCKEGSGASEDCTDTARVIF